MTRSKRHEKMLRRVRASLTPDLLKGQWQAKHDGGTTGHCYVAAESCFYLVGGFASDYRPHVLSHRLWPEGLDEGETHWFLRNSEGHILDPTADQFDIPIAYDRARKTGFLTNTPSRRARVLMSRAAA